MSKQRHRLEEKFPLVRSNSALWVKRIIIEVGASKRIGNYAISNKPISHYIDTIKNAEELHLVESAFYCLASHLDLSKVKEKICYYPYDNAERLGVFKTGEI